MKKKILPILTFSFLFILSGCGSNSKPDTAPTAEDQIAVEMQNNYVIQDESGINFTLAIPITKKLDSSHLVTLNGYDLRVNGCTMSTTPSYSPATLTLNGALNSVETLYVTGTFNQPCIATGYTFTATQKVTKDSNADTRRFSATFDYSNLDTNVTLPVDTTNYNLKAVPSSINISTNDTGRVLDLYLSDVNAPVVNQEITAQFVDPNNGTLGQYTATTDATGHVAFNYTRPETLVVGHTFDITFEVIGGTVSKSATVGVTFVAVDFDYTLKNTTTPLLISFATQEKGISAYLVDNSNVGIEGKTLSIATIDDGYGSVSSSTATTDASGKATFAYTAPDDITNLIGTSIETTLRFTENGTTISKPVIIMISSEAIISDYSLVNPAPTADIHKANQITVLDIQLIHTIDGNEIPVIDVRPCTTAADTVTTDCIIPEVIPRKYGRISNAAGSNTGNGYLYFDFEGPESGAPGYREFYIYYIDANGEISATNTLSVDVNIP